MRRFIPILMLALTVASGVAQAQGQWPSPAEVRAMVVEAAERHGGNAQQLTAIVSCETGGSFDVGRVGRLGERGGGQWLPGAGNAWRLTSHAREGVDIVSLYRAGSPDAPWLDIDGLAQAFAYHPVEARNEWFYCSRR